LSKKAIIIVVLAVIWLVVVAVTAVYVSKLLHEPWYNHHVLCEIPAGATGKDIADLLYSHNIIKYKTLFHMAIRWKRIDTTLKAGHYLFTGNLSILDVINKIVSGEIFVIKVMIPEGLSIYRVFRELSDNDIGSYDRYIEKSKDLNFIKDVTGLSVKSLEGFLYPDTYIFAQSMSEESVIRTMVKNFYNKVYPPEIKMGNLDQFYKDIILASIVEKEAKYNYEKPMIAGIYLNRIKKNMKLQADPTVTYHLEQNFQHIRLVTYAMTRENTPFNTYVIDGLPPQPICSPTVSSIFATQNPEASNYLFFFTDSRGRFHYTETYQEHIRRQNESKSQ